MSNRLESAWNKQSFGQFLYTVCPKRISLVHIQQKKKLWDTPNQLSLLIHMYNM